MDTKRRSDKKNEYATREDFCQVFDKDLDSLYQLAFLLTADHDMAQSIFVAGIDECAHSNPVFKQWARSWARRVIIRSAVRLLAPAPRDRYFEDEIGGAMELFVETNIVPTHQNGHERSALSGEEQDGPGMVVARLSPFNRFVFIMSVLERIPDRECAALLCCGTADIENARVRALQAIALAELREHETESGKPAVAAAGGRNDDDAFLPLWTAVTTA